ncbi:mechanosensitive ion channel family protein [Trichlorobacter ammonificans]|uniref:Mechanosensitive ion channel protein n=1 Tax=Trichlorobacter ammonificans TaxID=2916410 RepID=A0ABM9D8B1_9BACT|nr:mechanosensitive ion channel family protein [Trichlorobacter ammonificans]CAH2031462.1 Mechanosensitive ion channel protein [Trichlorobacter ammonificans]
MTIKQLAALLLFLLTTAGTCRAAPAPKAAVAPAAPAAAPSQSVAEPVLLDGKPVLTITSGMLSFTPKERARTISERLDKLSRDRLLPVDRIAVVETETTSDIVLDDRILMNVTAADARGTGSTRQELARQYAETIRTAVTAYRSERSTQNLLVGTAQAMGITLLLVLLLVGIKRAVPRLESLIGSWKGRLIRSIRFQSIEFLHEDRIVALLLSGIRFVRLLLVLGLLYLYVPLVLSFFPMTEGMAARLFGYIETPVVKVWQGVTAYLPNIFFILVITVCTWYVIRFSRFLFHEVEKQTISLPGFYPDWAMPSFKIVRFLIIAFAVVVAFPYLPGSESPAFKGVSVFLGVLFSLGSSSAIANVVAGVILTYMRAFTVGDQVRIADTMGEVIEKTLLVTRIRTAKNVDITVPNSMVLGSHITNYSSSARLILHTTVTIGYDVPWRRVHELLQAAARSTDRILADPQPFVLQTALNDFSVSYELNVYTDAPSAMATIYSTLHANIQDRFNEAGVEIMSPHYSTLRDGNGTTIPADYLPADYQPPAIRVTTVTS